jgi:Tfp pilus assembly protein PilN
VSTLRANLLPGEYRRRYDRAQHLRLWATVAVAVIGIELSLAVCLGYFAQSTRRARDAAREMSVEKRATLARLAELNAERGALERQQERINSMRRKHRWSLVLSEIERDMPATVMLTSFESDPPRDALHRSVVVPQSKAKDAKPQEPPDTAATGLVIQGMATDHEAIASFLDALNEGMYLGRAELESTSRQPFLDGEGIAFTIRARWE